MKLIDNFLNQITMYRLVVYVLRILVGVAILWAYFGWLPFSPSDLLLSVSFLFCVGWSANKIFARAFQVHTNVESYEISVYILALIIWPTMTISGLTFLFWAAILAIASKFIVIIDRKHIFNPAAIAVVVTSVTIFQSASWWIGDRSMLPFVFAGGLLIVRKLRRFDLFFGFLLTALTLMSVFGIFKGIQPLVIASKILIDSPIIFFAMIMLTEPSTTPPTRTGRIIYGAIVGILLSLPMGFGSKYLTPEMALVLGNIFSFAVSPRIKLMLRLKEKIQLTPDKWEFVFIPDKKFDFIPGQYMEWTLPPEKTDNRGNRRYFTLASSPTEESLRIGVKFHDIGSIYKKRLLVMSEGSMISAGQLAGEFVLNRDPNRKYVFLAGGIGITPFRSIVKYLLDSNQKRDLVLFYSDKTDREFIYREIFDQAVKKFGSKIFYLPSDKKGHVNFHLIKSNVADFKERYFYISGSRDFVDAIESEVRKLGVPKNQIKTDFFPGFV